jgi:glutamate-ammonia-ligase adenylyltransferase
VLGSSPPLTEVLIRTPEYFHWLVAQVERSAPDREDLEEEIGRMLGRIDDRAEGVRVLSAWKQREVLRIGTRDLLRRETLSGVTAQLSDVAAVAVDAAVKMTAAHLMRGRDVPAPGRMAVVGLGALGGRELGYRSRLDLMFVFDGPANGDGATFFEHLSTGVDEVLRADAADEQLYEVRSARSVLGEIRHPGSTFDAVQERLSLLRARPVAGNAEVGARFIELTRPQVFDRPPDADRIQALLRGCTSTDGARQIEQATELFQLAFGGEQPLVRHVTTLAALDALHQAGILSEPTARELSQAYVFLRTVEHRLQLVGSERTGLGSREDLEAQVAATTSRVSYLINGLAETLTTGR